MGRARGGFPDGPRYLSGNRYCFLAADAVVSMDRRRNPWLLLVALFLLVVGTNAFIIAPSSITPLFVDAFGVDKAVIGDVVSAAFIGMIVVQIPGGYLIDRYDNRWLLVAGTACYGLVVLAIQFTGSFQVFLLLRAAGGVAIGFLYTAGANVVGEVFAGDRRGLATGLYTAGPSASFGFAHLTSPPFAALFGPLRVFLLQAAVAFVGVALLWVGAGGSIRSGDMPTLGEYGRALGNPGVVLVAFSMGTVYSLYIFLNTWLPTYGVEQLSLSLAIAGVATAVVPLVGIVARPGGGWLSGYLGGRHRLVMGCGLLAGLLLMILIPFAGSVAIFFVLIGGAAFCIQVGPGVSYVLTRELAGAGTVGTSLTVLTTISLVGSFFSPMPGGWLITQYSWRAAFVVFGAVGVAGIAFLVPVRWVESGSTT